MKDFLSKLKTEYHFRELSWKQKTAVLLPIIALSLVVVFGGIRINYNLEQFLAAVGISGTTPQAVILVDEPIWYSDRSATVASRKVHVSPRGYAPFPVFFQGWQSEPRSEIVDYRWNFGDGSRELTGFNSAHVFERPGTYTVTLTVKNKEGLIGQDTILVTILDRKDYMSSTGVRSTTYYVAPEGDDSYTGKCEVKSATGNCGPWKTAQRAFNNLRETAVPTKYNPNDSVLFKRGGSYTFNQAYPANVSIDRLLFGSYGVGDKPIIQYDATTTTPGGTLIRMSSGSGNVSFVDLVFKFKSLSSPAQFGGVLQGVGMNSNLLALRVEAEDLQSQFFTFGKPSSTNPAVAEAVNTGVFVIDSKFSVSDAQYTQTALDNNKGPNGTFDATFIYGYMGNLALIGNTFDRSYNHLTYLTHLNKAVIIDNNFSRPAFGRDALRIDGGLINGKGTNNVYIADNNLMGWRDLSLIGGDNGGNVHGGNGAYNYQLINFGPNGNHDQALSYITFERNTLTNFLWGMKIADADHVIVRNNLFVSPNQEKRIAGVIMIGDRDWEWRPNQDIAIVGNTFAVQSLSQIPPNPTAVFYINPFNKNNGTSVVTEHQNISILNNLIYRPTNSSVIATAFAFAPSPTLVSQLRIDGNLYNVQSASDGKMFSYYVWTNGKVSSTNYFDLKSWQETYGFDLNGQASNSNIDFNLFDSPPIFFTNAVGSPDLANNLSQVESYKRMFRLKNSPTNPAIDGGVNVGAYLPLDFFGTSRPNGSFLGLGNYDVGFFELTKENKLPIADFTLSPATGTVPLTVIFDGRLSRDPDGTIRNYNWTFDGSSTGTGSTTSHTYQTAGSYQVKLEVDDGSGGKATAVKTLSIASADTTKPITTAGPGGGNYDGPVTVTLSANEPANIFACSGLGCKLIDMGLSPINFIIDATKSLFYYAKDLAGNIETTQTQNYVVGACVSNWSCDNWSTCDVSGVQTRICNDVSACGPVTAKTEILSCGTAPQTAVVGANGLAGSYFGNRQLSGTPLLRTDSAINFNWSSGSAYPPLPVDNFSVRWEGLINIPTDGSYTFYMTTDDGGRLWIDGQSVVDSWVAQRETEKSGAITLTAGRHALKMEYFDASSGAIARLAWSGPGIAKAIIPSANLYLSGGAAPVATTCTEKWSCGRWQKCSGGIATRTCTDTNACGTTAKQPTTSKACR